MSIPATTRIPAVLIVAGNKTYGRTPNGRLLYRATPNDKTMPSILVPYEEKLNFCKAYVNKYILMRYTSATTGEITETIGPVDVLANCYQYELHCNNLIIPMPTALKRPMFSSDTVVQQPYVYVFTIDGETTKDFDDAFSIAYDAATKETAINIYIANVPLVLAQQDGELLRALGNNDRTATIYLPDKNIPMLPAKLSEQVCSLVSSTTKQCFVLSFHISQDGRILRHQYSLQTVTIARNYVYDSPVLLASQPYKQLANITRIVFEHAMFAKLGNKESHMRQQQYEHTFNFMAVPCSSVDVVTYWMLMMNTICAADLAAACSSCIYRIDNEVDNPYLASGSSAPPAAIIDANMDTIIRRYYATTLAIGEYTINSQQPHKTLNVAHYCHVTSPIRRLVDAVNMAALMLTQKMVADEAIKAKLCEFVSASTTEQRIDFINNQMRAIKKAQRVCELLAAVKDCNERRLTGILIHGDSTGWDVYLPSLNLFTKAHVPTMHAQLRQFDKVSCRVYMFQDEASFKRKVRVSIL